MSTKIMSIDLDEKGVPGPGHFRGAFCLEHPVEVFKHFYKEYPIYSFQSIVFPIGKFLYIPNPLHKCCNALSIRFGIPQEDGLEITKHVHELRRLVPPFGSNAQTLQKPSELETYTALRNALTEHVGEEFCLGKSDVPYHGKLGFFALKDIMSLTEIVLGKEMEKADLLTQGHILVKKLDELITRG
ncbi:hypothetical protein KA107_02430 [Candidatus Pacearchaeota archaeon]|nr:hypothetical protein [Candidatus Pacearchaeota archaeon]